MDKSLKKAATTGLLWSLVESVGSQGTRLIIGIVLARILVPEMFGVIAMVMVFVTIGQIFVDSGFGTALIQKQKITELEICSVFYFNVIIGFSAAVLIFFLAPTIAAFYGQPILTSLTRALSCIFIINSVGMIHNNLLVRNIDFKSQAKLITISNLGSGLVGIVLAMLGFGVWSLAIQQIMAALTKNCLLWLVSNWRPKLLFSIAALQYMFKFGLSVMAIGILNRTTESIYYMVIGKLFSANDLGLFSRAQQLQDVPSSALAGIAGRVGFPVLSKLQLDRVSFEIAIKKSLTLVSFLICPIMVGIASVANPLVVVLFTEKWLGMVPYLRILAFAGMIFPMEWLRQQGIQAAGRPDLSLRAELIKKLILLLSVSIMWHWGIFGITYGIILASFISLALNIKYIARLTSYTEKDQVLDILPYIGISLVMGGVVFSLEYILCWYRPFYQLLVQALVGSIFYVFVSRIFHLPAYVDFTEQLNSLLRKR